MSVIKLDLHRKTPRKPIVGVVDPNPAVLELFRRMEIQHTFQTIEGAEKAIREGLKLEFLAVDLSVTATSKKVKFVDWATEKGIDVIVTSHADFDLFTNRIYKKAPICCVNKPALTIAILFKSLEVQNGGTNETGILDCLSGLTDRVSPTVQQWRQQHQWWKRRNRKN